jgi:hypothetical protein
VRQRITCISDNPVAMIFTHPLLFNGIVVLFIAFTAGWLVYVINSRKMMALKDRMEKIENEKEQANKKIIVLEEQLEKQISYPLNNTPVITLSPPGKANKTN